MSGFHCIGSGLKWEQKQNEWPKSESQPVKPLEDNLQQASKEQLRANNGKK